VVTDIVDGDTIIVDDRTRVQLLGVDAIGHSWGDERSSDLAQRSAAFTALLLKGKSVQLRQDPANDLKNHKDRWGRVLSYVFLEDGAFLNLALIEQGYATAYLKYPFRFAKRFKEAEERARMERRGLWSLLLGKRPAKEVRRGHEIYIAKKGSRTYHKASCLRVKNIAPEDRIRFHEEEEARKLGFSPGRWCLPVLMKRFSLSWK